MCVLINTMMKFQKQVMSAGVSEKDQGLKMKNYFEILWNSKDFLISYKLRNDSYNDTVVIRYDSNGNKITNTIILGPA